MRKNKAPSIIMLGTAFGMMGGIASVINVYQQQGLFEQWPIKYIATHVDGGSVKKGLAAAKAWLIFLFTLFKFPDLIHIHTSSATSFWRKLFFILPAMLFRRKIIVHLHADNFDSFYNELSSPLRFIVRKTLENCSCVIVLSEEWLTILQKIAPQAKLTCIYNPVILPARSEYAERQNNISQNILFLGRLGKRKGTYDLIKAFACIADRFPTAILQLGGDGEIDKTKQLITDLKLTDRIQVLGWISGDAKKELLINATIYALPSYSEGLPMGILEAMSFGLPIISTPVGGIPGAVRDNQEGLIVPVGDIKSLAGALAQLLSTTVFREQLGAAARVRAEKQYSAKIILDRINSLYQAISQ